MPRRLTAIIEREGDGYISLCPELDIASQGATVNEARSNLKEALDLFFEVASATEIEQRLHNEVYVTQVEVAVGQDAGSPGPRRLPSVRRPRLRPGEAAGEPCPDAKIGGREHRHHPGAGSRGTVCWNFDVHYPAVGFSSGSVRMNPHP